MNTVLTITRQWQIYIPEKIRQLLDLEPSDLFEVEVKGKTLVLKPKKSEVSKLAGKYKHLQKVTQQKKINLDKIRDQVDYAQDWKP